ncbi:hypothetical protein GGR56DRAFT_677364 [Xylariaceae sp. FL0804]|nr:hypothetical protein GGR56DRAFT_677364 [Xylariaceae sp. FL0804]
MSPWSTFSVGNSTNFDVEKHDIGHMIQEHILQEHILPADYRSQDPGCQGIQQMVMDRVPYVAAVTDGLTLLHPRVIVRPMQFTYMLRAKHYNTARYESLGFILRDPMGGTSDLNGKMAFDSVAHYTLYWQTKRDVIFYDGLSNEGLCKTIPGARIQDWDQLDIKSSCVIQAMFYRLVSDRLASGPPSQPSNVSVSARDNPKSVRKRKRFSSNL